MTTQETNDLRTDIAEIKADIRNLLNRLNGYVPEHCISHSERITTLTNEITAMKENQVWLWRTVAGAAITSIAAVFVRIFS